MAAIQESTYSVGQTALALASDGFHHRSSVRIFNDGGGGILRLGGPNVTAAAGLTLPSNTGIDMKTPQGSPIYAISENGTNKVRLLEIS